jgi:hypothetical protein
MKLILFSVFTGLLAMSGLPQGTLVYDQQSSTDERPDLNGGGTLLQQYTSYAQSFTPSLGSLDFVRLKLNDNTPSFGIGATLHVNVRSTSFNGPVLASSLSVVFPNGYTGVTNFLFPSSVPLSPGTVYYLEPIIESGDQWNTAADEYNYPGGMVFANGVAASGSDMWFREGIIVPEPSSGMIALFGVCSVIYARRRGKSLKQI